MTWPSLKPTEHQEQKAVIEWACAVHAELPEAALIFAIPNGGRRVSLIHFDRKGRKIKFSPEGNKLKAEGVRPGMPDLFLPVARQEWHGLFIEMKTENGRVSLEQQLMQGALTAQRYAVCVCRGADAAVAAIRGYLTNSKWSPSNRRN